jgi:para-aminobenzoate synthetase component 1
MTGAPKVRAMQRIAELEGESRGIYSGAVGWWAADGSFDLAVVIRSLVYDAAAARLSYHVGGAITWDSDPAEEYAESELKAGAIRALWG